jgi:hypothetical protein
LCDYKLISTVASLQIINKYIYIYISSLRPYFRSHSKVVDASRRYPYFDAVVGLEWSNDPESYAGGSVATGRASHARQIKGDDPDKKVYPGRPGWVLSLRMTTSPHKNIFFEKLLNEEAKIHREM